MVADAPSPGAKEPMNPLRACVAAALLAVAVVAQAKKPASSAPADGRLDAFYIGHSLNADIPDLVAGMFAARAKEKGASEFRFREQVIIGGSLAAQWGQGDKAPAERQQQEAQFGGLWCDEFPKGGWDAMVFIESVPRGAPDLVDTLEKSTKLVDALLAKSPKARVFFYEPWHCIHSGTERGCEWDRGPTMKLRWRERLDADAAMWDGLVADLRRAHPKAAIALIPAGRGLGMLSDAARAGSVPGFASHEDFFDDDIHLNPHGKYFVACMHYAALSGQSPVGLPVALANRWTIRYFDAPNHQGRTWKAPSEAAAKRLQEIAWAAAQGKPDPGLGKGGKKKAAGGK